MRAIGSKIDIIPQEEQDAIEFYEIIEELLETDYVKQLDEYEQHCGTSRLQHSVNVAYYSYLVAKSLHLDYQSAARGALLHDLFFYDWKNCDLTCREHSSSHPKIALKNAKEITEINKIEEDIIIKHMWPMTLIPPKYLESYIVSFADKFCATVEVCNQGVKKLAFVK